jgi:hypothetical protein
MCPPCATLPQYPRFAYLRGMVAPVTAAMKATVRVLQALGRYRINWNFDCERCRSLWRQPVGWMVAGSRSGSAQANDSRACSKPPRRHQPVSMLP